MGNSSSSSKPFPSSVSEAEDLVRVFVESDSRSIVFYGDREMPKYWTDTLSRIIESRKNISDEEKAKIIKMLSKRASKTMENIVTIEDSGLTVDLDRNYSSPQKGQRMEFRQAFIF